MILIGIIIVPVMAIVPMMIRVYFCAVGDAGSVIWSSDGGETWEDRSIPGVDNNLYSFDFLDYGPGDLQVVVCGEGGTIYKSTNSGGGWDLAAS